MQKPTASQRLPERARLAAAIAQHRDATEQLARIAAAIDKIKDDRIADRVGIGRAREALKIARHGRSEIMIAAILGEPAPDLPDPAEAERTLDACEARLDATRSALAVLEAEAQRARSALGLVEMTLASALKAAVAADPALAALRAEFERCRLRMSVLIGSLLGAGIPVSRVAWTERAFVPSPAWTAAIERLRADPDAPLPNLPPDGPDHAHARDGIAKRAAA